jgi:hypothetical protein
MKTLVLASMLLLLSAPVFAPEAQAQISINLRWNTPPPLVEVAPGVQVVENHDEEIFVSEGHYWVERDGRWYWSVDHHGRWALVPRERVPVFIREHRRGQFRHWRRVRAEERREERHEVRQEERREERKEAEHREEKREERREHEHDHQ